MGFVNGTNTYLYCLNNPVNFVDTTGLEIERQIYGSNFNPSLADIALGLGLSPAELLFGLSNPFANIDLNKYTPTTLQTVGYGATALVLGGFGTALAVPAVEASILPVVGIAGNMSTGSNMIQQLSMGHWAAAGATSISAGIAYGAGVGASLYNPLLKEPVSSAVGSVLDMVAKAIGNNQGIAELTQ